MEIGKKIKRLRIQNGLTQEELADRAELSKGFISQVERELTSPSIATLIDLLQVLGTDLQEFFRDSADQQVVFTHEDQFVKVQEEDGFRVSWIVPNAQKNAMEPILLTLESEGTTELQDPHEGEEFGYVLKGVVKIHLGRESYRAKKGESFYFQASKEHFITNPYKQTAEILWVSTPPSF